MKVLVIPEDPTHDSHILKPVIERILADCGRRGTVDVLQDPHLRGASQALDRKTISEIILDYRMIDLFVLIVDRDCDRDRHEAKAATIEADSAGRLLSCLAIQELEVWPLFFFRNELPDSWATIRASCDPKEEYFDPLMKSKGWNTHVGGGRKTAMRAIATNWTQMKQFCEEIEDLAQRFSRHLT